MLPNLTLSSELVDLLAHIRTIDKMATATDETYVPASPAYDYKWAKPPMRILLTMYSDCLEQGIATDCKCLNELLDLVSAAAKLTSEDSPLLLQQTRHESTSADISNLTKMLANLSDAVHDFVHVRSFLRSLSPEEMDDVEEGFGNLTQVTSVYDMMSTVMAALWDAGADALPRRWFNIYFNVDNPWCATTTVLQVNSHIPHGFVYDERFDGGVK